jgi:hypothetical protein
VNLGEAVAVLISDTRPRTTTLADGILILRLQNYGRAYIAVCLNAPLNV